MTTKKLPGVDAGEYFLKKRGRPLSLGDVLAAFRLGEEMSLAQFSKFLGISPAHLCDIEKMRRFVSPGRAAKFAHKLGHPDVLFVQFALNDLLRKEGLSGEVKYYTEEYPKKKRAA